MNEDKLKGKDNENLSPETPSKPLPTPKDEPLPASSRLTPSELESLLEAERSSRESTKKLYPHTKFI